MRDLIRFWFSFDAPVGRRSYLLHGVALTALKVGGDVALVRAAAGVWWFPPDYVRVLGDITALTREGAADWLPWALAAWMVPFVVIGSLLTLRRALDAGASPWLTTFFFVPVANYALIAVLCLLPTRPRPVDAPAPRYVSKVSAAVEAIAAASIAGVLLVAFAVYVAGLYGAALFIGTPFLMGAVAAYWFNQRYRATAGETTGVVVAAFLAAGGATILFAVEGAVCVLMALPIALAVGAAGSYAGRRLALLRGRHPGESLTAVLALPLLMLAGDSSQPDRLREVRSTLEIDAPAGAVWRHVVAFPRLDDPSELLFRAGIAYPVAARIEGAGVGATRYCEFSTGAFVEPITVWEPGQRLAFDVTRQPAPLAEWSPYAIAPPHLDGFFRARRGEFRLVALPDGRTRLEGSTWYELRIAPGFYWSWYADAIVSRIHMRVLRHVARLAEAGTSRPADGRSAGR